jgi:(2Fe-2S) ferredoxin
LSDVTPRDPALLYQRHVFCCTNVREPGHKRGCCSDKGSAALRDYMKAKCKELGLGGRQVRVNAAGCLDRCELGPTMVIYPEGVWYTYRSEADIDEIIARHLLQGKRVERLELQPRDVLPRDRERRLAAAAGEAGSAVPAPAPAAGT